MAQVDFSKPPYDTSTYIGRAFHFFRLTNPLNLFVTDAGLDEAKKIVDQAKKSKKVPKDYTEEQIWSMKYLVDSAFHPDTGEKMTLIGRMSAQAPMNTIITGCMITFYKTTAQTVFWQWLNQTFNAVVNYTNRSGDEPISQSHLFASYCAACGGALTTALVLNAKARKMKNPVFARLVPFAAVCGANFINIPMMRSNELMKGTPVFSEAGVRVGESKTAAQMGIFTVCISRIIMALPGMVFTPYLTNYGLRMGWFCKYPNMVTPFQIGLVGLCVTFATPLACAIFDQRAAMPVAALEEPARGEAKKKKLDVVYYNKGL